jgi:hypothetical protein
MKNIYFRPAQYTKIINYYDQYNNRCVGTGWPVGPKKLTLIFIREPKGTFLGQTNIMEGAKALVKKDDMVQAY